MVNELLNPNSELKKAIQKALIEFRSIYNIEIKAKEEKDIFELDILEQEKSFTEDFEELNGKEIEANLFNQNQSKFSITKNAYEKFYIKKNYKGKENEVNFIQFLESQNIDWWHKQEDSGRDVFAIEYYDIQEKRNRLFYPDFIVKKEKRIYLLDTKSGNIAKSQETADKNKALQKWIKNKKENYDFEIIGGILEYKHPNWRINRKENYIYEKESDWENVSSLINS